MSAEIEKALSRKLLIKGKNHYGIFTMIPVGACADLMGVTKCR